MSLSKRAGASSSFDGLRMRRWGGQAWLRVPDEEVISVL
jgi:hypothetical protein